MDIHGGVHFSTYHNIYLVCRCIALYVYLCVSIQSIEMWTDELFVVVLFAGRAIYQSEFC